ncbi:hypothetical protein D0Y65_021105 [Glycine soja]|uniref:Uncharacterized protein n=1 Tax=Glycine soja TaxID=3848 RepID=A0A445JHJ8_GLYSO|nr:hypothetical protein D0Y65_021105 [Glycine soja]
MNPDEQHHGVLFFSLSSIEIETDLSRNLKHKACEPRHGDVSFVSQSSCVGLFIVAFFTLTLKITKI